MQMTVKQNHCDPPATVSTCRALWTSASPDTFKRTCPAQTDVKQHQVALLSLPPLGPAQAHPLLFVSSVRTRIQESLRTPLKSSLRTLLRLAILHENSVCTQTADDETVQARDACTQVLPRIRSAPPLESACVVPRILLWTHANTDRFT